MNLWGLLSIRPALLLGIVWWGAMGQLAAGAESVAAGGGQQETKKILFIAGPPSHNYGAHEHYAGSMLLAGELQKLPGFETHVSKHEWPSDPEVFKSVDAIVIYCDGGGRHIAIPHLDQLDKLARQGVGIVCIHYAVEVPKGEVGDRFLQWIGGYFETHWSVNPHWTADFDQLPEHPISRGVQPFKVHDEWYYHMRFAEADQRVRPILTDIPPPETLSRPDGSHSGNPHVRQKVGQPQHVAWAVERKDGGRGFGFTGGHFHWNWADPNFRKIVLNAIVWCAGAEVAEQGVPVSQLTLQDLEANQDYEPPKNFDREEIRRRYHLPLDKQDAPAHQKTTGRNRQWATQLVSQRQEREPGATDEHSPDRAVAGIDVADGLEATLFAAEPQVRSLTNLDVDHRGRVWACEVVNYRGHAGKRPEGDRILILEDQNGDGSADETKVYYQGPDVDSAMGICVLGNRVIVSATPNIIIFTDENGDDRPDRKELLFTKTGQPQHDHSAHTFIFGPDGKLYWNFGNTGIAVHDRQGQVVVDLAGNEVVDDGKPYYGGMVFRCNMDGSEFEVLAHNFRNNYETTVDSYGNLWQSDNDDDGNQGVRINYVMEYGNYGYRDELTGAGWREPRTGMHPEIPKRHWHLNDPGVVPNLLQTGAGSPAGITIYEGELLPKVFRDEIIHCDPGPNVVRAYPVQKDGAGFKATIVNLIEGSRDDWFRPADVCVAPDGSLFVTDWYDPGVGGHQQGDLERGRVFRIAPTGHRYRVPPLDLSSEAAAVAALQSPNFATRYLAWRALEEMGTNAEEALLDLFKQQERPRMRARALWALGKLTPRGEHYVDVALKDSDADIRIVGLRLARQLKVDMAPLIARLVEDSSPQLRRECLVALRHCASESMPQLWTKLALQYDGHDRWYLEALGIAAHGRWDACLKSWLNEVGNDWQTPAGRDIIWRSRAPQTPGYLAQIISNPAVPVEQLPRFLRALDFQQGPAKSEALAALLKEAASSDDSYRAALIAHEALLRLPSEATHQTPHFQEALQRALEPLRGSSEYVALVRKFSLRDHYRDLLELAQALPDEQVGVEAMRTLLEKGQQPLLREALRSKAPEQAISIAQALGNAADGRAASLLLDAMKNEEADEELRRNAARAAAKTRNGAQQLIEMARQKQLDRATQFAAAFQLHAAPWEDIRQAAHELFPMPPAKNDKPLPALAALLKMDGDPVRGQKVFETSGQCATCHTVRGQGKEVGPDLSGIGRKLSREALFESILYPSAGISHNYETYTILADDGNIVTGIITSQSDDSVTVKLADALERTLERSSIEEMKKQDVSLMPADLQKSMTAEELVDVVEYLTTLQDVSQVAEQ